MRLRPSIAFGIAFLAAAQPATAAGPYVLECELVDQLDSTVGTYAPVTTWYFTYVTMTVDPDARTLMVDGTTPDGKVKSVVRDAVMLTPSALLLCQADTCQKDVSVGQAIQHYSLTKIDLDTGALTREVNVYSGTPGTPSFATLKNTRTGNCRKR